MPDVAAHFHIQFKISLGRQRARQRLASFGLMTNDDERGKGLPCAHGPSRAASLRERSERADNKLDKGEGVPVKNAENLMTSYM